MQISCQILSEILKDRVICYIIRNYEELEIFELLVILRICLIIQTIGPVGCMENQTNKGYNEEAFPKLRFLESAKTAGFTGTKFPRPPGFETISVYD
jgi:hypothetical protein